MIEVTCLDTGEKLYFAKNTAVEAMMALIYYLNLNRKDENACVLHNKHGTLQVVHHGKTWSCVK